MRWGVEGCPECAGHGFVVRPVQDLAVASACACVPTCERCRGTGRVLYRGPDGVERLGRCRCQALPDRLLLFNRSGVPARHAQASFQRWDHSVRASEPAFQACWQWLSGWPSAKGLVLHGEVGRGKTHLLVSLVRELVFTHGVAARFVEFTHLLAALKEGFDKGESAERRIGELVDSECLAIDELGKGRNTEWEKAIVDELVSRRYNANRVVLATTNHGPGPATGAGPTNLAAPERRETLEDRVGDRVYSRLRQMTDFVPVKGEDYRIVGGGRRR